MEKAKYLNTHFGEYLEDCNNNNLHSKIRIKQKI